MSTQEEAVAVMLDNGVLEWVRQRPPKGTKLYSQARIDQLEKELAAVRTGKEQALFVAATEMERLETELAEARKSAEPPELLTNIHALSEWACDAIDEAVSELLKHSPTSDTANKLYMVAGRLSALSSDVTHWQEARDAAIDKAMEAK